MEQNKVHGNIENEAINVRSIDGILYITVGAWEGLEWRWGKWQTNLFNPDPGEVVYEDVLLPPRTSLSSLF